MRMKTTIRRLPLNRHDPWTQLNPDDARRVNSEGQFDFFWVVLEGGLPGLMLKLPFPPEPAPKLPKLKNLVASFRPAAEGWAFVLGSREISQTEIFETLCRDVVRAGEAAENRDDALARAIQRTRRWHHLLRGGRVGGLSVEEQRGLVGELAFLRELVTSLGSSTSIEAWTDPTGSAKDFELIGACIEIKTLRSAAKPHVTISSEDQLTDVEDSRVFLRVTNVASAVLPEGQSLHDHVRMTAKLFETADDAFDAWEEAIYSTGYDPQNDYGERRWQLGSSTVYEVIEGFPRISTPLPAGVERVRYSLALDACTPFTLDGNLIEIIREGRET